MAESDLVVKLQARAEVKEALGWPSTLERQAADHIKKADQRILSMRDALYRLSEKLYFSQEMLKTKRNKDDSLGLMSLSTSLDDCMDLARGGLEV